VTLFLGGGNMRILQTLLLTAAAIGLAGCSSMVSLHPIVPEAYATFDPALIGLWADKDDSLFLVKQDGRGYKIRFIDSHDGTNLSARLYKAGDLRMLDLVDIGDNAFQLKVHTAARVWVEGGTLRLAWLDTAWLKEKARKCLAVQDAGESALVTTTGDTFWRFLLTYGADEQAVGKEIVLQRQ